MFPVVTNPLLQKSPVICDRSLSTIAASDHIPKSHLLHLLFGEADSKIDQEADFAKLYQGDMAQSVFEMCIVPFLGLTERVRLSMTCKLRYEKYRRSFIRPLAWCSSSELACDALGRKCISENGFKFALHVCMNRKDIINEPRDEITSTVDQHTRGHTWVDFLRLAMWTVNNTLVRIMCFVILNHRDYLF